jgi:hypothetical protein
MGENSNNDNFLSVLYHALRARRRRETIRLVRSADTATVSVRHLARNIAAAEHGLSLTHATGEPYRNAYNALCQTHLPTLADAGIVIYDSERQTVAEGPNLSLAALLVAISRPAIETLQERESTDEDGPL